MKAYIGIDLGTRSVAAFCPADQQKASRSTFSFETSISDFQRLLGWVKERGITNPVFIMEASGIYWVALYAWLLLQRLDVALIRPTAPRHYAQLQNKRTKNDSVDARTIAEYGANQKVQGETNRLDCFESREAARYLSTLVADLAKLKNRLHRHFAVVFPEYRKIFKNPAATVALALFEAYPTPAAIVAAGAKKLAKLKVGLRRLGPKRSEKLLKLAETSVGSAATRPFHTIKLQSLIRSCRQLQAEKAKMEAWIEANINPKAFESLTSFPGCAMSTATRIAAEIGDPKRFPSADKVVAFAGITPRERQTGDAGKKKAEGREPSWKMSKQGNRNLRLAIYQVTLVAIQRDPRLKAYYEKKVQGDGTRPGKKRKVALGHCMRKVLVILWTIWRKEEKYQADKLATAA